jgi:hypothetical protein
MFKKVEVFHAERVVRIIMFISSSHDLAKAFSDDVPFKRLIFSASNLRPMGENGAAYKHSRLFVGGCS